MTTNSQKTSEKKTPLIRESVLFLLVSYQEIFPDSSSWRLNVNQSSLVLDKKREKEEKMHWDFQRNRKHEVRSLGRIPLKSG
jgi:hypothetical protein